MSGSIGALSVGPPLSLEERLARFVATWHERLFLDGDHAARIGLFGLVCGLSMLLGVASMWSSGVSAVSTTANPPPAEGSLASVAWSTAPSEPWLEEEGLVEAEDAYIEEVPPPPPPVGDLNVRLIGTAVTDHPAFDTAIIRHPGRDVSRLYHPGDVVDGYRLERVERRQVTFVAPDGEQWRLRVSMYVEDETPERVGDGTPGAVVVAGGDDVSVESKAPAATSTDSLTIPSGLYRRLVTRGVAPARRITPRQDGAGKVTGFTLDIRTDSLADRLGLQSGDVVVSVEGIAASEMQSPNDVLRASSDRERVCMGVEQRGVVTEVCYRAE